MTAAETTERTEGGAPPPERRARHRRTVRRLRRPFALLCALAFFFAPVAARILGQHATPIENHKLASFPSPGKGFAFFAAMNQWSIDHLPLRQYAIRGNAKLSQRVFGQPPAYGGNGDAGAGSIGTAGGVPGKTGKQQGQGTQGVGNGGLIGNTRYPFVLAGKDGWLYFGGDPENACVAEGSVADNMAALSRLAQAAQASGRRFLFTVAPNKSTVYPDKMPDSYLGKDCMAARAGEFWNTLNTAPPSGYFPVRAQLEAQQKADGVPIYRQTDTHWAPRGAAVYAQQLANALQPGLFAGSKIVSTGPASRVGDMSVDAGNPHVDKFPGFTVERPGVTAHPPAVGAEMPANPDVLPTATTTGPPLFQPRTLLLGDSFTAAAMNDVVPLFANLTLQSASSVAHMDQVTKAFTDNKVIVFEVVERTQVGGHSVMLQPKYLAQIIAALRAHPLR